VGYGQYCNDPVGNFFANVYHWGTYYTPFPVYLGIGFGVMFLWFVRIHAKDWKPRNHDTPDFRYFAAAISPFAWPLTITLPLVGLACYWVYVGPYKLAKKSVDFIRQWEARKTAAALEVARKEKLAQLEKERLDKEARDRQPAISYRPYEHVPPGISTGRLTDDQFHHMKNCRECLDHRWMTQKG
jgi:hypothetical protein